MQARVREMFLNYGSYAKRRQCTACFIGPVEGLVGTLAAIAKNNSSHNHTTRGELRQGRTATKLKIVRMRTECENGLKIFHGVD